ncbi:universal stress protein [Streptomyces sp. PA03-6a]|nr:universal stress protein [Streptomyces sp. PA03-6a]
MSSGRPATGRTDARVADAGRFRLYLGMASGVGTTYAMLDEAARRAARGCDVVAGIVETHGRPATAAAPAGLEVVPPRTVAHRGGRFAEMDLDAILARGPGLVLVDEPAHTDVPGSGRHEKRRQDVLELLDADVSVISTLNIQHVESLAGVVEAVTGTPVRERVPDAVPARAEQIELVDSSPEQLRRRMLHGNVHPAERIHQALGGFFTTENLTALRELTLRYLAGETDAESLARMRRTAQGRSPDTAERVLAGVAGAPGTETVLRRAGRIAGRLDADLYVVHIRPGEAHRAPRTTALRPVRQLSEDFGGTWIEIADDVPARALVRAASEHRVTRIVLGPSRRGRWEHLLGGGSTVRRLTRLAVAEGIDVHILARSATPAAAGRHADGACPGEGPAPDEPTWSG